MRLKLLEPLKEFFKDEVRVLGKSLGLVKEINYKHPFPGPWVRYKNNWKYYTTEN